MVHSGHEARDLELASEARTWPYKVILNIKLPGMNYQTTHNGEQYRSSGTMGSTMSNVYAHSRYPSFPYSANRLSFSHPTVMPIPNTHFITISNDDYMPGNSDHSNSAQAGPIIAKITGYVVDRTSEGVLSC